MDTVELGQSMDRADILNGAREAGEGDTNVSSDYKYATLKRPLECPVKMEVVRQELFAGSQRRLVNKHIVDTSSGATR